MGDWEGDTIESAGKKEKAAAKISAKELRYVTILSCSNPADFAQMILTKLNKEQQQKGDEFFVQRLLVLFRKFARRWKPA
ncbi:MAG: hypothetical protein LBF75_06375 [Treponema sp.]|nr:hypothetical protein [Treponema sp.]